MAVTSPPRETPTITDEFLTCPEVAQRLRVSNHTLIAWRRYGHGPRFFRMGRGRRVFYRKADIDSWLRTMPLLTCVRELPGAAAASDAPPGEDGGKDATGADL